MKKTINFYSTDDTQITPLEGGLSVESVVKGGTYNGLTLDPANVKLVSLMAISDAIQGRLTGEARHTPLSERTIGNEAVIWTHGSWDDEDGLSLNGRFLDTDAGRNALRSAEAGIKFGVSIVATAEQVKNGKIDLLQILFVDLVMFPAVDNKVVAYQEEEEMPKEIEIELPEVAQSDEIVAEDTVENEKMATIAMMNEMREMVKAEFAAELAATKAQEQTKQAVVLKSKLPAVAPKKDRPFSLVELGQGFTDAARKIYPERGKKFVKLMDHYRKVNKQRLALEHGQAEMMVKMGIDWDTLPGQCEATGRMYELVCENSYALSIFPSFVMDQVCQVIENYVVVDDPDFPTQDTPAAEALVINALNVSVPTLYGPIVPMSSTLVNTANPLVVLEEGVDFLAVDKEIYLLTTTKTTALNVAVNSAFTLNYTVSLYETEACQPQGRKKVEIVNTTITARPIKAAIRYCDMILFQIQRKYGDDFADRLLRRVIGQMQEWLDKRIFQQIWVAAMKNGSIASTWSKSTETIEQLIEKIGDALVELIDTECAVASELIIITNPTTANTLGRSNDCCRIDATNDGEFLGQVGTVTQHAIPLISIETTNLVYGNKVLVTTRDYYTHGVFQPLAVSVKDGGVSTPFTAPSGAVYNGLTMETETVAFMQVADLINRPTQARIINIVA